MKSLLKKSNMSFQTTRKQLEIEKSVAVSKFSEAFLKERIVKNRKQIYISAETFEIVQSYLKYISDVSFIAYVDNMILQHIEEHKDLINELFKKVNSPFKN